MPDKPTEKRAAWLRGVREAVDAELDGRETEAVLLCLLKENGGPWMERVHRSFDEMWMYRAKPQPTYRPFTAVEAAAHIGGLAQHRRGARYWLCYVAENCVCTKERESGHESWPSFQEFRDDYVWQGSGSPCGVLVAEGNDA